MEDNGIGNGLPAVRPRHVVVAIAGRCEMLRRSKKKFSVCFKMFVLELKSNLLLKGNKI